MAGKKRRVSARKKIIEVISRYPEGLNAAKIRELVLKEHAVNEGHIAVLLVQLTREGKLTNTGRCKCRVCATQSVVYKVNTEYGVPQNA